MHKIACDAFQNGPGFNMPKQPFNNWFLIALISFRKKKAPLKKETLFLFNYPVRLHT
jgi:hypothetical protein